MHDFSQEALDALTNLISSTVEGGVHTSSAGKVVGVTDNFTATLKPDVEITTDDGEKVPYPAISGVKILMPCGSGGTIGFAFPVAKDDGCVALYGEGGVGSDFKFDLSNALLLPGLSAAAGEQVKRAGKENAAIMFAGDSVIFVSKDKVEIVRGKSTVTLTDNNVRVALGGTSATVSSSEISILGDVKVNGNIGVNGNVTISGILTVGGIVMNTHTHSSPSGQTGVPQ